MRGEAWPLVLVLVLLAACAPEQAYEPPTATAAVIGRRPAPPPPPEVPPPTQLRRPPHETSTAAATATVLGATLGVPVFVLVPTPETMTLSRTLPPVGLSGELPGTLDVISTLHSVGGVFLHTPGFFGPTAHRGFAFWWLFPLLPFPLWNTGVP
jgi:hypothetical protein